MVNVIIAILLGPLDAARGGYFLPRVKASIATWVYSAAVALMLGAEGWLFLAVMIAFRLGESFGWGCPLGAALRGGPMLCDSGLEWWQRGPLKRDPWLALLARGALWGLPVAALGFYFMLPLMAFAMVAAPAAVRAWNDWEPSDHLWGAQEFLRGWIIGAILLILTGSR